MRTAYVGRGALLLLQMRGIDAEHVTTTVLMTLPWVVDRA